MQTDINLDMLENLYNKYFEKSFTTNKFKHKDICLLIDKLKKKKIFKINKIGKSVENREIYLLQTESGLTDVLFWSQMHGDESTGTMALFDLFNFLINDDSELSNNILTKLKLHFIPMLNPDGAEINQRRNALNIDLNRDALKLESPESKLLKNIRDKIKPSFGFNLHDQHHRYTVGRNNLPVALSFLAPAYDYEKTINSTREKTMQLIADMFTSLNNYIPNKIAKYDDSFEPRAFGDNMMKWGTSSVLIESGYIENDINKQIIRKLNFFSLIIALNSIINNEYQKYTIEDYSKIPENKELYFDLKLKNVKIEKNKKNYKIDIGINRYLKNDNLAKTFYFESKIEDIGDLSIYYGHNEIDCSGLELKSGKTFPEKLSKINDLQALNILKLLKQGYCSIIYENIKNISSSKLKPFNALISPLSLEYDLSIGNYANFLLYNEKNIQYLVINGFLVEPNNFEQINMNGLFLK